MSHQSFQTKLRIALEQAIVTEVIKILLNEEFAITVYDEEACTLISRSTSIKAITEELFQSDENAIAVYTKSGGFVGEVQFIYGNDGIDVVHDYSRSLENILDPLLDDLEKHIQVNFSFQGAGQ